MYSASDMATIISGVGISKALISATPTGTANQYDVVYEVYARNYGNSDITNFQITDSLGLINGNANVSNVSISFPAGGNPAGLTLNTAAVTGYTGTGAVASNHNLLNGTGTLPNFPTTSNFVTIRIACRLSNILSGITYNNSAIAKGTGFNSQSLRDSSANGSMPDLNSNDKPDDVGEGQPTPLLIAITAQTPPCTTLGQVFYKQNFGTGANSAAIPTDQSAGTTYTGSTTQPLAIDRFMIASNANAGDNSRFISLTDHTTGTGRMMIVNADATNKVFYTDTLNSLCGNQQYSLGFYAAFVGNASYSTICDGFGGFKYPKVKMRIKDLATGLVITEISTANITSTSWGQYGMKWVMPSGYPNIIFELINDGQGGCGNDLAIDDIELGICDAAPQVSVSASSAGCMSSPASLSAALNDPAAVPGSKQYQWQISTDDLSWTDITGATSATYTIASVSATDVGKYYRVLVAAAGNIGSASCRYTSPGYLLSAKSLSAVPTSAVRNRAGICPGETTSLRVSGGTLGTNAVYRWYSGSCGGTLVGTGTTISVNPTVTTTYYVRIEGDCNTTACIPVTVTVACDIDADDDGVPDVLEALNVDPKIDDDFDGTPNWRDGDYAGFADTNGDGVNDNFDLDKDGVPNFMDRDSDNDGIADVVEAGGGDADGNGVIDSYTDSDADGFSDNVDANLSSHLTSGSGLGALDTDGDGVPNYLDLDSDNDGVPDVLEVYGADSNNNGAIDGFADSDGDGLSNSIDGDADGNGTVENVAGPLLKTGTILSNGRAGSYPNKNMDGDSRANPYDLDSDGDGIADVIEAQLADLNYDGRIDGAINARGWSTTVSSMVALTLLNSDASGRSNVYDIDSDDDGIPDNVEGMSTSAYLLASGGDSDADGIDNTYDNISGWGGKGITPFNKDGDALPDYLDTDTDGDGVSDRIEGNDFNFNGKPDDDVVLTGVDTDGDGLDNKFDADNASARGTSQYMGNGGSFAGPSGAGSRATVQKTLAMFTDRDWRQVEYILDLEFLSFSARLMGERVVLSWEVLSYAGVSEYVVEESTDGVQWRVSGRVPDTGAAAGATSGQKLRYSYETAWKGSSKTYYRIKAHQMDQKTILSNIQSLKKEKEDIQAIQVVPNPVVQNLRVVIFADTSEEISLLLLDSRGRKVRETKDRIVAGVNAISIAGAEQLPNGHYFIRTFFGGKVYVLPVQVRH